jgi:uncharacterized membrane protein YczE
MGFSLRGIPAIVRRTGWTPERLGVYLAGCVLFSLGATFFIGSDLGTDPLDVFVLGVREHVPITIGLGQATVAAVCIAIWASWNRRRPIVSPFVTFFFCGSLIDLLLLVELADATHLHRVALMVIAGFLCAYGSALIIMSAIGIRAMDLVAITMVKRWYWPFWAAKGSLEAILLTSGWAFGGPVGVGTVWFLVSVNLLIPSMISATVRMTSLTNHGLPARVPRHAVLPAPEAG